MVRLQTFGQVWVWVWTAFPARRYLEPTSPFDVGAHMADTTHLSDDEQLLAKLGYKQELNRSWSGFSNFAILFSIISILAGCFTTFGQAWNNGGPIHLSIGLASISAFLHLDRLADHLGVHPRHRPVHVRAGVGVPDLGRDLLVGEPPLGAEGRLLHG